MSELTRIADDARRKGVREYDEQQDIETSGLGAFIKYHPDGTMTVTVGEGSATYGWEGTPIEGITKIDVKGPAYFKIHSRADPYMDMDEPHDAYLDLSGKYRQVGSVLEVYPD